MTSQSFGSNGNGKAAAKSAEVLPHPAVDSNSFLRLSLNSAFTFRPAIGQHDLAVTLQDKQLARLKTQTASSSVDLDGVDLQAIQTTVHRQSQGLPELMEVTADDLDQLQRILRDLANRRPTKLVRHLQEFAAAAVEQSITPLRAALDEQFDQAPFQCLHVIEQVDQALRDLHYPVTDFTSQKRFAHGLRAIALIEKAEWLSAKLRASFISSLRKRCFHEFQKAIAALVNEMVAESLRHAVSEFLPFLDELRTNQSVFCRNLEAVRKLLEQERTASRQRNVKSRSSVILEMESPSESQLLAGIRDRHRCADTSALVQLFSEKLHLVLNETARQRYPLIRTPATMTELVVKLPPRETAAGVTEVVADLVGDLHTVYTAVRTFGVQRAARELYDRAAPLCSLSSRDHTQLNVEPHRDLIVRLPRPRGPEDGEIAERTREEFRDLQPACQILEDPLDTEITVVRTLVGFPIGIEATNAALLFDYAESARQGHRPHLVGLLPDSPRGEHLPQLLALAQRCLKP
jgi:hypothetical protein